MDKFGSLVSDAVMNVIRDELAANRHLVDSLTSTDRPSFLFGCVPPLDSTLSDEAMDIASKFSERGRVLAVDGYIVYDVQDESIRTSDKRPFPYRKLADPLEFAKFLRETSHKGCVVYKAVTCMESALAFDKWLDECSDKYHHAAINIVGAPSTNASFNGPSTKEASAMALKRKSIRFGAVCIAERHAVKHNEHLILFRKQQWGAKWFITQGIYDPDPTIQLINDYGAICKENGVKPRKIILTFTPCGRKKTMEFIKWLGMQVPPEAERMMFDEQLDVAEKKRKTPVELSCILMCENLKLILQGTHGVPLGINVESVSGFKNEIDATHDLFRSLQAILLDSMDSPWVIRWSCVPNSIEKYNSKLVCRSAQVTMLSSFILVGFMILKHTKN